MTDNSPVETGIAETYPLGESTGRVKLRPYDDRLRKDFLGYLSYEPGPVRSSADLIALQRAYLDRIPYENLQIQLGRPTTIDPEESARRILTGRGGYCLHLNGALAGLLLSLGYPVTLARGRVLGHDDSGWGEHMILLIEVEGEAGVQTWVADVGLGDGFRDPIPLAEAEYVQPPFRYRLRRVDDQIWAFHHDEKASIPGFELDTTPVPLQAFDAKHAELSTSPESSFVQKLVVQARRADHALTLRGCVLIRADAGGEHKRVVDSRDEWFDLLTGEFGLRLDDVDEPSRVRLWDRVRAGHEAWVAADESVARLFKAPGPS